MNNDELMETITSLREQLDMMRRGKNTWLHKAQALRRELEETKDELFYYKNRSTESTDKEMEDLENENRDIISANHYLQEENQNLLGDVAEMYRKYVEQKRETDYQYEKACEAELIIAKLHRERQELNTIPEDNDEDGDGDEDGDEINREWI